MEIEDDKQIISQRELKSSHNMAQKKTNKMKYDDISLEVWIYF